jgi:hypothetical protein
MKLLLPAFQVRVLTWTGGSSSNPERAQGDKFLAVNDLNGYTAGGVRAVKAFKSLSMRGTPIDCQVGRNFTAQFFGLNPRFLSLRRHNSFSSACERPLKCSFNLSLGSTDLNWPANEI